MNASLWKSNGVDKARLIVGVLPQLRGEVEVEEIVSEGRLSAARDACEAGEEIEWEREVQVFDVVLAATGEGEKFFRFSTLFLIGDALFSREVGQSDALSFLISRSRDGSLIDEITAVLSTMRTDI